MSRSSRYLLSLVLLLCGGLFLCGRARAGDLEDFLTRVEQSAAKVNSFSCDFRQERHLALFARPVVFTGHLYLVRPDRLRWEFSTPIPSLLILDGNIGRRCGQGIETSEFRLDRDPVMRLVTQQLRTWTSGDYRDLEGDFTLSLAPGPSLVLAPRQPGLAGFLSRITVKFDPRSLQPSRVEIDETGGDSTVLDFTSYRLNPVLPAELFAECKPAGRPGGK